MTAAAGSEVEEREKSLFPAGDVLSMGASAPRVFKTAQFDFNLARFLGFAPYSGADIGECLSTAHRIVDGDLGSWRSEWHATARRVERIGIDCRDRGHRVSAREAFMRASVYYLAAFFFVPHDDPAKLELYHCHRAAFRAGGALFDAPFQPVEIPYEGRTLPGYFLRPDGSGAKRPTVLIQPGGDGTAEMHYFGAGGAAGLRRGYNVLLFEGPGQQGAFTLDRSLVYRHDWEVPVGAVIDYAVCQPEVDRDRIALVGDSMAGYFVPRAAAFDKRISACIAACIVPDCYPGFVETFDLEGWIARGRAALSDELSHRQVWMLGEVMQRFGANGIDEIGKFASLLKKMSLWGLEERITCPVLNISTTGEGMAFYESAKRFFGALPRTPLSRFVLTTEAEGAELHCMKAAGSLRHQIQYDWLDEVFGSSD